MTLKMGAFDDAVLGYIKEKEILKLVVHVSTVLPYETKRNDD